MKKQTAGRAQGGGRASGRRSWVKGTPDGRNAQVELTAGAGRICSAEGEPSIRVGTLTEQNELSGDLFCGYPLFSHTTERSVASRPTARNHADTPWPARLAAPSIARFSALVTRSWIRSAFTSPVGFGGLPIRLRRISVELHDAR